MAPPSASVRVTLRLCFCGFVMVGVPGRTAFCYSIPLPTQFLSINTVLICALFISKVMAACVCLSVCV